MSVGNPGGFLIAVASALQVATPLQQAKCELLAFPWTPDVLAMCNLLAASANDIADLKRSYDAQNKGNQMPFNALLMPEMATLQDASGALSSTDLGEESAEHQLGESCATGRGKMASKTLDVHVQPVPGYSTVMQRLMLLDTIALFFIAGVNFQTQNSCSFCCMCAT